MVLSSKWNFKVVTSNISFKFPLNQLYFPHQVESISGDGTYTVNGGNGAPSTSGGGSGGIIAIDYLTASQEVTLDRFSSFPGSGEVPGGPGLVYLQCSADVAKPDFLESSLDPLLAVLPSYTNRQLVIRGKIEGRSLGFKDVCVSQKFYHLKRLDLGCQSQVGVINLGKVIILVEFQFPYLVIQQFNIILNKCLSEEIFTNLVKF